MEFDFEGGKNDRCGSALVPPSPSGRGGGGWAPAAAGRAGRPAAERSKAAAPGGAPPSCCTVATALPSPVALRPHQKTSVAHWESENMHPPRTEEDMEVAQLQAAGRRRDDDA